MSRANDGEVSIQRRNSTDAQSLGKSHHGGIDGPEGKVAISGDELCDPHPIAGENWLGQKVPGGEISKEPHFRRPAQTRLDETGHFGDHELRHEQRAWMGFEELQAHFMIVVIFVDVGVERAGIDDQRDRRASCRMISSMRRAVSRRPLRPALAAIRRRRAPLPR
jgi:hypothetical protein